ncbi:MAG: hypothetical protein HKN14_07610 [Marinicaulis sp.]|nr:hypothetical protein [Marinicaulis sp.]
MSILNLVVLGLLTVSYVSAQPVDFETNDLEKQDETVKILILGVFHFTGGGNDEVNSDVDNMLSRSRQAEIDTLVSRLEIFAPDKILLEMPPEHEPKFNAIYEAYLDGEHELSVNERQQLGMRLAARLNHKKLYGVDYSNGLDYRPALAAAEQLGQLRLVEERAAMIDEIIAASKGDRQRPLLQRLRRLNSTDADSDHYGYLTIAQMGSVSNPQGALQIIKWWERNLVIFARSAQYSEPGEKILIIVGAGHLYLLRQFFREARGFELVDTAAILE